VDDGSTDSSLSICKAYEDKDARIAVFSKENGGMSSARNFGIEQASGSYLGFVDSDDFIEPTMYETLYNLICSHDVDVAVCSIADVYEAKPDARSLAYKAETILCSGEEALRLALLGEKNTGSVSNKLFRRTVLGEIRFPLGLAYEDARFFAEITAHIRTVAITTEPLYCYFHRSQSVTTSAFDSKTTQVIDAYHFIFDLVERQYPALKPEAYSMLYWAYYSVLDSLLLSKADKGNPTYREVLSYLRSHFAEIIKNPFVPLIRKIAACALALNVNLYGVLLKLRKKQVWGDAV
jgi:glycosyltransferase involved in cell wall biosynthesis